jgi:CBS domain-containing protein
MRTHHVGDLVVVEDPRDEERVPLGVVTDRDLAIEVLGHGRDPAATTLGSLIRRPVVLAHEEEDTSAVIERMRAHGVRRIPVVDARGSTTGIITLDDLIRIHVEQAAALVQIMAQGQDVERRTRR